MSSISVIWELTGRDLEITRFVFNDHSALDHSHIPAANVFQGATEGNESAPSFDVLLGRLTVGKMDFHVVDENKLVSAWLGRNDGALSKCNVRRLIGLKGNAEATYDTTFWQLEDYAVGSSRGGSYKFTSQNILKQLSKSIHDDIAGEANLNANITDIVTTITMDKALSDSWPTGGGHAVLYDTGKLNNEVISYTGISGSDLTGVVRGVFGTSNVAFDSDNCEVYHVWVKRGNPMNVMLELMFSSDAKVEQGASAIDGGLENWTADVPDDWSSFDPGSGNTLTEETGDPGAGSSSARITYSGSDPSASFSHVFLAGELTLDHYLKLSFLSKILSGTSFTQDIEVTVVSSAGYSWDGTQWVSGSDAIAYTFLSSDTAWNPHNFNVLIDSLFVRFDSTVTVLWRYKTGTGSGAIGFDTVSMLGFYTHLTYDVGDGVDIQGAGILEKYVDVTDIETVRDVNWPQPAFDGNGDTTAGVAVLLVEKDPIRDVKTFIEKHLLQPFGAKPVIDVNEKLTILPYFDVTVATVAVGDKWDKMKFTATKWKRNYSKKVNNIRLLSDWNLGKGEHEHAETKIQATSVKRYGEAKALELSGRGCRTGLKGYPDYSSVVDMLDGIGRIFLETANPFSLIEILAFYEFRGVSAKDNIVVNVPNIPDLPMQSRGIVDGSFFLDKKIVENKNGRVKMTLRQRRPVARPAFIAPNTHATNYTAASTAERNTGCYLTPGSEVVFANGDDGYTIIGGT